MQARPDPRAPFVLDMRELGRRPGAMQTLTRTAPAPAGLGLDVITVPEGSDLTLDIRLESVSDGVLVTATVRGRVVGECSRCLDPIDDELVVDLQELFLYPEDDAVARAGGADPASEDDSDELFRLDGDFLDLEAAVRDVVVTALPLKPLCQDDCPGLCAQCGARLIDEPEHAHDEVDPRWAALQDLAGATAPVEHDDEES